MADSGWVCASCGAGNPAGTRFCGHCGTPAGASVDDTTEHERISEVLKSFVAGPVAERILESGGQVDEERRLVTALFADLSGFTALAGRLDPEALLEVIDPVVATLSSIVWTY